MAECLRQAVKVVVVRLLQVLSNGVQHPPLAVAAAQVRIGGSPVQQITRSVFVRAEHDSESVVRLHVEGVGDSAQAIAWSPFNQ